MAAIDNQALARSRSRSMGEMAAIPPTNMLLGVPKKGRLFDKCSKLLQEGVGMEYRKPDRVDVAHCSNMPVTLVFLPAHDIATYVGEGNVDMGITGLDVIAETEPDNEDLEVVMELGFGKCMLAVQGPATDGYTSASSLAGQRIVTSFPLVAAKFFKQFESAATGPTKIKFVSGSVEAACGLGLADGIVDLVETGTTMRAAGLEIVEKIMDTQAVLIKNKRNTQHLEIAERIKKRIEGWHTATKYQMIQYNIEKVNLDKALAITPGKRSPTVSALEESGWLAVSSLVKKDEAAKIMDDLQSIGADSILIFSISNSRM